MKTLLILLFFAQVQASEIITTSPVLPDGRQPNAAILNEEAVKNWTSGGSGCCVMASNVANANHLQRTDWAEEIRAVSLTENGGHTPDKLDRQFQQVREKHPDFAWRQWHNVPDGWERVKQWSASGVPIGITWGTGQHYGMQLIYHMVSCTHADDEWVQIKDNNYPDEYSTVPEPEGKRRWEMGGLPWAVVLVVSASETELIVWGCVAVFGAGFILILTGILIWKLRG